MKLETRGVVARNGRDEWCYFAYPFADGIPLTEAMLEALGDALPLEVETMELPGPRCAELAPDARGHPRPRCTLEHDHAGAHRADGEVWG